MTTRPSSFASVIAALLGAAVGILGAWLAGTRSWLDAKPYIACGACIGLLLLHHRAAASETSRAAKVLLWCGYLSVALATLLLTPLADLLPVDVLASGATTGYSRIVPAPQSNTWTWFLLLLGVMAVWAAGRLSPRAGRM